MRRSVFIVLIKRPVKLDVARPVRKRPRLYVGVDRDGAMQHRIIFTSYICNKTYIIPRYRYIPYISRQRYILYTLFRDFRRTNKRRSNIPRYILYIEATYDPRLSRRRQPNRYLTAN